MEQKKQPENGKRPLNAYVKYSALGFQMIGIIGAFTFAGYKLDQSRESGTPIYTAILSLVGVAIALYFVFKGINK
ncbi:AtpZ/AtpI family protein [Pelobium manganitolerans]|uniref:AtpZ/AtpI family protein n=1 Tax=Pelobium manganitolerans TaxID=1842495 RepID=UPI003FA3BDD0